jgi:hypothetical protein
VDISSAVIPAVPEVQQQTPPQNAQLQAAVRESAESEPSQDDNSAGREANRDPTSNVGRNIDERV